ncbi:MAG: signal peptidase I [Erysipelotrichaceae bacterium]
MGIKEEEQQNIEQELAQEPQSLGKRALKECFDILKIFIICSVVVYLITTFIAKPIKIEGDSMYPVLEDTEIGITNVFSAKYLDIKRGDVVIIYAKDNDEFWVKRVVGLPNETISGKDDHVLINGKILDEPYLNTPYVNNIRKNEAFTKDFNQVKLGKEDYFLMGDNRIVSHDSRARGPFKRDDIVGKNAIIIYPFDKIKIVD